MSVIPVPDERTRYSSARTDEVDVQSWPEFGADDLRLLESVGQVIHPEPGEVLWEGGESYDLYLVRAGGVCLLDRRDDRVVAVVEPGDFVGELGMLMGQPAFLAGVAMPGPRCCGCTSRPCAGSSRPPWSWATCCSPRSTPGGAC